ncbi:hypothetical protein FB561_2865 [Kribbella amoyensis]|uniref:Uncharacterized protein n=1 Tax=Kribbella amoyensis TaxID=996641 RepID=A0A561BSI8_9ACTN|nr:hypothetical protein [Kribbella amoyensis]TWD81743.1 hypothetical protein FB561_2865 [Kribbella amoyensis]
MRYEEFLSRYKDAYGAWELGTGDPRTALTALAELVPQIDDPDRQQTAIFLLGEWEAELSPETQERMSRASAVVADAQGASGSTEERIEQAEAAMRQVTAIAQETTDESEQYTLLALNEPLALLVDSWRAEP